jgi:ubiquinone/menaquinone biosynthesis C-methylase UbiE
MKEVLDKHYQRLAKDYDDFLYYSPEFVRTLTSKMIDKLQLKEDDVLVDLGCGTGMYSLDILKQIKLKNPILGVDPYPEMLAAIPDDAPIEPIAMDGLDFAKESRSYDKVLIKETVHHIAERDELFTNIYKNLNPGGILLLVHVPPNVQYPLFEKALNRCLNWHANPDELTKQLKTAGFSVERDAVDYQHSLPKEKYFKMVEGCYMSALTSLSDEDIQEGIAEMEQKYKDQSMLEFIDHFDYLTAVKS